MAMTLAVINDIDTSTEILVCFLQEQGICSTSLPPHSLDYDMFTPPGHLPKCATYVRKDLGLNPRIIGHLGNSLISLKIMLNT